MNVLQTDGNHRLHKGYIGAIGSGVFRACVKSFLGISSPVVAPGFRVQGP